MTISLRLMQRLAAGSLTIAVLSTIAGRGVARGSRNAFRFAARAGIRISSFDPEVATLALAYRGPDAPDSRAPERPSRRLRDVAHRRRIYHWRRAVSSAALDSQSCSTTIICAYLGNHSQEDICLLPYLRSRLIGCGVPNSPAISERSLSPSGTQRRRRTGTTGGKFL